MYSVYNYQLCSILITLKYSVLPMVVFVVVAFLCLNGFFLTPDHIQFPILYVPVNIVAK